MSRVVSYNWKFGVVFLLGGMERGNGAYVLSSLPLALAPLLAPT